MLRNAGVFPGGQTRCLEIGFGALGWLGDLVTWGVAEGRISGIDLNTARVNLMRAQLPNADLRAGDASELPWDDCHFQLVIASTVFSSILDLEMRSKVANEIERVLTPGGSLLWYDFRFFNPRNPDVRCVTKNELRRLFPRLEGRCRSVTLAPPLCRMVAPLSWILACMLGSLPFLRTHLLAVLLKPAPRTQSAVATSVKIPVGLTTSRRP